MGGLLYIIAVILVIGWILGFFVFHVGGGIIHVLLVIAIIAAITAFNKGREGAKNIPPANKVKAPDKFRSFYYLYYVDIK